MFTSHKSEPLPSCRQSSLDSQTLESWMLQCSDGPLQNDMHSPERQRRPHTGRRSSVFNLRSRSNTTTSSTSHTPTGLAEHESWSHECPPITHHLELHSQDEPFGTAKSLFRGMKGKRVSGSVTSSTEMEEDQEADAGKKRMSVLRRGRRRTNQLDNGHNGRRRRISSPFDFRHLSHTDRHQIAALDEAFGEELAAGFQAGHRSSSHDLFAEITGDHPSDVRTSHRVTSPYFKSTSTLDSVSPSQSPRFTNEWPGPEPAPQVSSTKSSLRLTRSVESFSQPSVPPQVHRHSQSVAAPANRSSLHPLSPIHDIPEESADKRGPAPAALTRSKRESGLWDLFDLSAAAIEAETNEESMLVGHALTTADESTFSTMTPPFSPSLEDVAEEPERFVSPRPAPQPPLRTPTTPKSHFLDTFSFGGHHSPVARNRSRGNSHTSPKSFDHRQAIVQSIEKALPPLPVADERSSQTPVVSHRKSNIWRTLEESWENDVDYIYENALEADCELDWGFSADGGTHNSHQGTFAQASNEDEYSVASQHARAQSSVLGNHPVYRIRSDRSSQPVSSVSRPHTKSASSGLVAEGELHVPTGFPNVADGFVLNPSLLLPENYKDAHDTMQHYEDVENVLDEYDNFDRPIPITDVDECAFNSARSSRIRSSRRSSYDSSLISSINGSGLWNSPIRRSASSAGSIPELVHSRRTRREFTTIVDELSEQVATLGRFRNETEGNYATTPELIGEGRTFFASEEDSNDDYRSSARMEEEFGTSLKLARHGSQHSVSVESELKTSLELVKQGSQHSKHTHRKKTSSSGTTEEQFATAEYSSRKSRKRATTTSHAIQQPHLSLFPTPPKHLPKNRV